jgi:hypothetical protein
VFTEVDRHLSAAAQISGVHWSRSDDRLGVADVIIKIRDMPKNPPPLDR